MDLASRQRGPIAVYGATGFTGRLVARELDRSGADFVLSGRNPARLADLAASLDSDPPTRAIAVEDPAGLRELFGDGRGGDNKDAKFNQETVQRNGSLKVASSGSPADLTGTSRRLVIMDDLSKFYKSAAKDILECWDKLDDPPEILPWDESRVTDSDEEVVIKQNWTEIRRFMWNYVGIVRTTKRLERAKHRIDLLMKEVDDYYGAFRVTTDLIELRNLLQSAQLIVRSALERKESRGLHYTMDYPELAEEAKDTVLVP